MATFESARFIASLQNVPSARAREMVTMLVKTSPTNAVDVILALSAAAAKASGDCAFKTPSPKAADGLAASTADDEEKLAEAPETSCLLPRGKLDLTLTPTALVGTAKAQRFRVGLDCIRQLLCVPKGDSVKPITLVVVRLRAPCQIVKANGKPGTANNIVMQCAEKDFDEKFKSFAGTLKQAADVPLNVPDVAVFRSSKTKPDCAVKCFCGVHDGYLYLIKGCILFLPGSTSNMVVLSCKEIAAVDFAKAPSGRSFEVTLYVENADAGGNATDHTFTQIEMADMPGIEEFVQHRILKPAAKRARNSDGSPAKSGSDSPDKRQKRDSPDDDEEENGEDSSDEDAADESFDPEAEQKCRKKKRRRGGGAPPEGSDSEDESEEDSDDSACSDEDSDSKEDESDEEKCEDDAACSAAEGADVEDDGDDLEVEDSDDEATENGNVRLVGDSDVSNFCSVAHDKPVATTTVQTSVDENAGKTVASVAPGASDFVAIPHENKPKKGTLADFFARAR